MAESMLSVVAELVLGNLGHVVIQETGLLCGFHKEKEKLCKTVSTIKAALEDVENGRIIITNSVRDWQGELKEVLYDADDVLDDFRTEALRWKLQDSITKKVRSFFSRSNLLVYNLKMGHRIKHIRERLDNIEKDRTQFELRASHSLAMARPVDHYYSPQRNTHSGLPSGVIGRDEDKETIVKLLMDLGSDDAENICVIPIVGMGGVGKTTLAKLVFNDDRIKGHFKEERIWVCVSDNFDQKEIVEKMLQSLSGEKCEGLEMETLQRHLRDKLDGKMFLLVLDDVWNENRHKWVEFKNLLMNGKRGSKILVTTRNKDVAKVMCQTSSHDLSILPDKESWYVFKQSAFKQGQETPALEEIGKQIAKKCGGLPLALSALGSLLYGNMKEEAWTYVRDSEMWRDLTRKELDVRPILKFSYDNLPLSELKHCFAYCALFPKDSVIIKEDLIKLWMAQGFLQSSNPTLRRMEDIGNHYFNVLLSRSFFQDVEEDDYGDIMTCKMHDLMHDLAQFVSGSECLIVDKINTPIQEHKECVRHMSVLCETHQGIFESYKLRTFINIEGVEVPHRAWSNFRYIRVLRLERSNIRKLPCSISELKHLRYLDLCFNGIKTLPDSIIKLQNLQTLELQKCDLENLPIDIGKIESLRHINVSYNEIIKILPDSICMLKNLQSLKLEDCTGIEELPMNIGEMISLRQLDVSGLQNIRMLPDSICKLKNLQSLRLAGCTNIAELPMNIGEMISLRQLEVSGSANIRMLPDSICKLKNLQSLRLAACTNIAELPMNIGEMISLRQLEVSGSAHIRMLPISIGNLTNLETLLLWGCDRLEALPCEVGQLTCLRVLDISLCPDLQSLPEGMQRLTALNRLFLRSCPQLSRRCKRGIGEDWPKISHIPHVHLDYSGFLKSHK